VLKAQCIPAHQVADQSALHAHFSLDALEFCNVELGCAVTPSNAAPQCQPVYQMDALEWTHDRGYCAVTRKLTSPRIPIRPV